MKKLLVDLGSSLKLQLMESYQDGKFLIARGEFGRADVPTQNRRVYPRSIWDREIRRINEAMMAGKVLGELDHPADGKTSLKRVSHIMCGLQMRDDGIIIGEAKILMNEFGNQLRSILEAGGAIGVSSRGMGSTAMGENGSEIVQDDYQYMTHDFVADPAVLTSYPTFQTEVRWIKPETVVTETSAKESSMAITEAKSLTPDEQKIANHLAGHPEIIKKVKAAPDPVQALGSAIDPHSLGIDANAQYELANVLDHYNIRHESAPKQADLEEKTLSSPEKGALPDSVFAYPKERKYPIPDIAHARNALARVAQSGTDAEQKHVRSAVYAKFPSLKPEAVEVKEVKEEKVQDNNTAPKIQEPNEVKPPEAKVEEAPKEELTPVDASAAVEANAEANVKAESVEEAKLPEPELSVEWDRSLNDGENAQFVKQIKRAGGYVTMGPYDETKGVQVALVYSLPKAKVEKIADAIEGLNGVYVVEDKTMDQEKQKLRESIKAELLSDPVFAAAAVVMENVKKTTLPEDTQKVISQKDEEIASLKKLVEARDKAIEDLGVIANKLGAQIHFERKLSEAKDDRAELLKIVGKQKIESVQQVDKILSEAKKQLESRKEEKRLLDMEAKRLEAKYEARLKASEDKTQKLEEALKNTVSFSKELGIKLYVEQKSRGNPNAMDIRKLCEGKTERKEVDAIIERFSVAPTLNEDYNAIKRRFERFKNTTLVEDQIKETGTDNVQVQADESGVLDEMKDLFPGATLDQVEALM